MAASKTDPASQMLSRRRATSGTGYRKGDVAKQRILDAALRAFAQDGFTVASTRQIAESAQVTLPALQYYFGGKAGLYTACAEAVAHRFAELTAQPSAAAAAALSSGAGVAELQAILKQTMASVAAAMTASDDARLWGAFAARELMNPGPAFEVMLERLWAPGIELVAAMIARIQGRAVADEPARIRALLMIASITAFQSGRTVAMRALSWDSFGEAELAAVVHEISGEIDRLIP